MNLLQFVAIKLTFFLVIGILLGYYLEVHPVAVFIGTFISLVLIAILHFRNRLKKKNVIEVCIALATISIGMSTTTVHRAFRYTDQIGLKAIKQPHLWKLKIKEELKASSHYRRFIASVEAIDQHQSGGTILCRMKLGAVSDTIQADSKLLVWASLKEINAPKNPYQFNYKKYLGHLGIAHQLELTKSNSIITSQKPGSISGRADRARHYIIEKLQRLPFGPSELSIIEALVLGYRKDIDKGIYRNYREAGAVHILAVSGLHVGIVLLFLQYLLKPLERFRRGKVLKLFICILVLWSFAFLTGFSASVIRAVTMFSFLSYALYLNRPGSTFNILALSMFFILLVIDPLLLFQLGFQMSYAAVFSILWVYPKLMKCWTPNPPLLKKVWELFSIGLAAQAGVLPLSLYYFHQFPGLFFLSNIIIVPFLGIILGMGILVVFLSLVAMVPDLLVSIFNGLILAMNETVAWIARQDIFLIKDINFDTYHLIFTSMLIICLVRLLDRFQPKRIMAVLFCILAIQIWNYRIMIRTMNKQLLTMADSVGATILLYQNGTHLRAITDHPEKAHRLLADYRANEPIASITIDSLAEVYYLNQKKLLIIDKDVSMQPELPVSDILLLSGSPRINLDRYLLKNRPGMIIADGSNYKSYVARWQKSCARQGISFHHTTIDGAIRLDLNELTHAVHEPF